MSDLLSGPLAIVAVLGVWVLLQAVILPRIGVQT